jgi:CHASE2 domain-containing sensor protein
MNQQKSKLPKFNYLPNIRLAYLVYFAIPFMAILPLRAIGFLQPLESIAFDTVMRYRPTELPDKRITIVGIDEQDLKDLERQKELIGDSISDAALARALVKISALQPAAIGLDVLRDKKMGAEGRKQLEQVTQQHPNIVEGYKRGVPDPIDPALKLPLDRIGFFDDPLDNDGRARRTTLAVPENGVYSLAFQISRIYLERQGKSIDRMTDRQISIKNKTINSLELTNATYPHENNTGEFQLLINYRHHPQPFNSISLRDIRSNKFNPNLIKDRVILIGYTAHSRQDFAYSNAIKIDPQLDRDRIPSLLYGVEYHAHISSQLISQVLDNRPNIYPLHPILDIFWLLGSISLGLVISKSLKFNHLSTRLILGVLVHLVSIGAIVYILILWGIWVPIAATLSSLIFSIPALVTAEERERQIATIARGQLGAIETSYQKMHKTPLLTIARWIGEIEHSDKEEDIESTQRLNQINQEIRDINKELLEKYQEGNKYPLLRDERNHTSLPLSEMLRMTFENKLIEERLNYLKNIDFNISSIEFNPVPDEGLTLEDKENICYTLTECLTNIDKYAQGSTYLVIQTIVVGEICTLEVADNSKNIPDLVKKGQGTKDMTRIAQRLGGDFQRLQNQPYGCKCVFSWQISRSNLGTKLQKLMSKI